MNTDYEQNKYVITLKKMADKTRRTRIYTIQPKIKVTLDN